MTRRPFFILFSLALFQSACGLGGSDVGNPFGNGGGGLCEDDIFECPDGSLLERDEELGCDFPLCPGED